MKRPPSTLLWILLPAALALGCQLLTGATPATQTPEADGKEVDLELGPGSFDLTDTRAGLTDLSSYTATLTVSFDGTKDGQLLDWSSKYVMLYSKEPAVRQLTIEKSVDISDDGPSFLAETDGASYEIGADGLCIAGVLDPANSFAQDLEPAGLLAGLFGAEEAGHEAVNGVEADHYTFDERALAQAGLNPSIGEVWVASVGGYIVRYVLSTKGDASYFGEGIEGTLSWDYQLTDVNQSLIPELSADCPPGLVDVPLLPDAANVVNMPAYLEFDTATSLTDALAFYQEKLPALGWMPLTEPVSTETSALLDFAKDKQGLRVLLTAKNGGAKIVFLLNRGVEFDAGQQQPGFPEGFPTFPPVFPTPSP